MSAGCVSCGTSATYVMFPLELVACANCFRDWIREESLSVEAIEAAIGVFHVNQTGSYSEHVKLFDAELSKRTRAWVAERKTARAAA